MLQGAAPEGSRYMSTVWSVVRGRFKDMGELHARPGPAEGAQWGELTAEAACTYALDVRDATSTYRDRPLTAIRGRRDGARNGEPAEAPRRPFTSISTRLLPSNPSPFW